MNVAINIINPGAFKLLAAMEQMNLIRLSSGAILEADNGYDATLAACEEARSIMSGKIQAKTYHSLDELNRELDAEYEAEYGEARC